MPSSHTQETDVMHMYHPYIESATALSDTLHNTVHYVTCAAYVCSAMSRTARREILR